MSESGGHRNRLARESSPYLLLHAGNPVDWYPWGEEAFERARREDKPIFLSVGYSTCYWCHVMERECFSDPEIARRLNEGFVSIKLDREERPDLDEIYMTATQLLTHAGGWPNSLFLTHDLKPFFAGTYFPPSDRHGRPGFPRVLAALGEAWRSRREGVLEQAEAVAQAIREQMGAGTAGPAPGAEVLALAQTLLARRFDPGRGGFGGPPKFPSPANLFFLLDRAREGDGEARRMLATTLDGMARGGIHDQLAGGFHRYSTDALWLVPHFEKMLYDNAALASLYAEADALAPGLGFARVARSTLDFVLRELAGPEGGFLSAIDAETGGSEGAYYTWTKEELETVLDRPSRALLGSVYGFEGPPNFEGRGYVLHLPRPLPEAARLLGLGTEELLARLEPGRLALLEARSRRERPLTDDKVAADWNGLMIAAMARASVCIGEPRYRGAAERAAGFVLRHHRRDGALSHVWRQGVAKVAALLDDYAFLVRGLLELHGATGEGRWLEEAVRLAEEQDRRLWDEAGGGYFNAGEDPRLLVRPKAAHDGAVVSGNGIAALNLLELARLTGEEAFRERAERLLRAFGSAVEQWPLGHLTLARALTRRGPAAEVRAAGAAGRAAPSGIVRAEARLGGAASDPWRPFVLDLTIEPGWHLNAHPASQPSLVATAVEAAGGRLRGVRYPTGQPLRAAFSGETIDVYSGSVRVEGELQAEGEPALRLTYQACDESRCLAPATVEIPLA